MNSYDTIPLNEETPLAMSRASKFGSTDFDGTVPNEYILPPFDNSLQDSYYPPGECLVPANKKKTSNNKNLALLTTCNQSHEDLITGDEWLHKGSSFCISRGGMTSTCTYPRDMA